MESLTLHTVVSNTSYGGGRLSFSKEADWYRFNSQREQSLKKDHPHIATKGKTMTFFLLGSKTA